TTLLQGRVVANDGGWILFCRSHNLRVARRPELRINDDASSEPANPDAACGQHWIILEHGTDPRKNCVHASAFTLYVPPARAAADPLTLAASSRQSPIERLRPLRDHPRQTAVH